MGRRSEQTFFCRGHSAGQQAHETMLNIASHQGNANSNSSKTALHTCYNSPGPERCQHHGRRERGAAGTALTAWGQTGAATLEESLVAFYQTKHTLSMRSSNRVPWYFPKGVANLSINTCTWMLYSSFIHDDRDLETTRMPFSR